MEFNEIFEYIKQFGLLPVLAVATAFYYIKNKEKIFKLIADHISQFLQNDQRKILNQANNDILIKDIHILELYLLNQTYHDATSILTIYEQYKSGISERMEDFKNEVVNSFKKSSIHEGIQIFKIRSDIIHYYQQEIREKTLQKFFNHLFEAISINGQANYNIFKTLLQGLLNNFVSNSINQIEEKFLYSKLR